MWLGACAELPQTLEAAFGEVVVDGGSGTADLPDAGTFTQSDAGTDAGPPMAPVATFNDAGVIDAPAETWAWLELPESSCGNRQRTGIGINIKPEATVLLIYLNGGGACWNALTCQTLMAAANVLTGYRRADFSEETLTRALAFSRTDPRNSLRNASYVFVPYCTGDVFAGDKTNTYQGFGGAVTIAHKGRANIEAMLPRLGATFPHIRKVILAGSSAGAFGVQLNYPRFAETFPSAEVHLLADSGQLIQPTGTLFNEWAQAWGMREPTGCPGCLQGFPAYIDFLTTNYPNRRFGLMAYDEDEVLRLFFGYGQDTTGFRTATRALLTERYAAKANAKYFARPGDSHTMLGNPLGISSGGLSLVSWIDAFIEGSSSWRNVGP